MQSNVVLSVHLAEWCGQSILQFLRTMY